VAHASDVIARQFDEPGPHAIFVDPALGDPFAEWRDRNDAVTYALALPETKIVRSAWPYLLELPQDQVVAQELIRLSVAVSLSEALEWQQGQGASRGICGWLSSSGELRHLAEALMQKAVLAIGNHEPQVFRFYDPRVLTHLFRYVREAQFFNGLPVLRNWTYLNTDVELVTVSQNVEPDSPAPVWFMTREQREKVGYIEVVNGVLRNTGSNSSLTDTVDAAISRCRHHHGWADPEDVSAFATLALRCHPKFDAHPKVAEKLMELRRANESFSGWANSLEDREWHRIQTELNIEEC